MNKEYEVKCKKDYGELYLSVTHNGYQWSSLAIKNIAYEIPLIIAELQRHLSSPIQPTAESCASKDHLFCSNCGAYKHRCL